MTNPFDDLFAALNPSETKEPQKEPQKEPEPVDPIEILHKQIEEKQALIEQRKAARESIKQQREAIRRQMEALREQMNNIDTSIMQEQMTDNDIRHEITALEHEITEEEHRRAEEQRLKELERRRNIAMAGFRNKISELQPAWEKYPFDYQWDAAATLALMGSGLLGDEMGLGKTLTSIMWLDLIDAKRVLIVGPAETSNNFGQEVMRWAPHRFVWPFVNTSKAHRDLFMDTLIDPRKELDQDFTICVNYEQLYGDLDFVQRLAALKFDAVILDEAHNMKNKKSVLFQRMRGLTYECEHVLPITGTFILNAPQDIWTSLHLIDSQTFWSENDFLNNYCEFNYGSGKWVFRSGGVASLVKRMKGRIVMRTFEEVAEGKIPAQYMHEEWISFKNDYPLQRKVIKQLAEHSQIILDAERKSSIIENLALITRNRQAINWPAGITLSMKDPFTGTVTDVFSVGDEVQESIKMDWVEKKARELAAQKKRVVIFSQFKTVLSELERRLSDTSVVRYDGDTDDDTRKAVKNDFDRRHLETRDENDVLISKKDHRWNIVLCNFKTGGVGLNFTDATETIIFDEEWNPGKNEQAYRRTKRMGQKEETHVYIPRVEKSIDSWLHSLNRQKRDLVDGFNLEVDITKEFENFLGEAAGE